VTQLFKNEEAEEKDEVEERNHVKSCRNEEAILVREIHIKNEIVIFKGGTV
jgi:hypothetical protein